MRQHTKRGRDLPSLANSCGCAAKRTPLEAVPRWRRDCSRRWVATASTPVALPQQVCVHRCAAFCRWASGQPPVQHCQRHSCSSSGLLVQSRRRSKAELKIVREGLSGRNTIAKSGHQPDGAIDQQHTEITGIYKPFFLSTGAWVFLSNVAALPLSHPDHHATTVSRKTHSPSRWTLTALALDLAATENPQTTISCGAWPGTPDSCACTEIPHTSKLKPIRYT